MRSVRSLWATLAGLVSLTALFAACSGDEPDGRQGEELADGERWPRVIDLTKQPLAADSATVERLALGPNGVALVIPAGGRVGWYLRTLDGGKLSYRAVDRRGDPAEVDAVVSSDRLSGDIQIGSFVGPVTMDFSGSRMGADEPVYVGFEAPEDREALVINPVVRTGEPAAGGGLEGSEPGGEAPPADVPLIVLYVIDTLRADRVGSTGGPGSVGAARGLTPRLDALAAESLVFRNACAASSWTRPAIATMLTGLAPERHGAIGGLDALAPQALTIAEALNDAGYATAGFVTNANVSARYGFDQGWDRFEHLREDLKDPRVHRPASEVHARALAWLDERSAEEATFLLVHVTDPHGPYVPPEAERARFAGDVVDLEVGSHAALLAFRRGERPWGAAEAADLAALYDAEVAAIDAEFGAFLDGLGERGLLERALVLVTSDHGEEFREHGGLEHGRTLYEEQLRVPLFVRYPGGAVRGVEEHAIARHADVPATILAFARRRGAALVGDAATLAEGRDLRTLAQAEARDVALAHLDHEKRRVASARAGRWKLVVERAEDGDVESLFNLEEDPGELAPVAAEERAVTRAYLRDLLRREARAEDALRPAVAAADPELDRALNALGY